MRYRKLILTLGIILIITASSGVIYGFYLFFGFDLPTAEETVVTELKKSNIPQEIIDSVLNHEPEYKINRRKLNIEQHHSLSMIEMYYNGKLCEAKIADAKYSDFSIDLIIFSLIGFFAGWLLTLEHFPAKSFLSVIIPFIVINIILIMSGKWHPFNREANKTHTKEWGRKELESYDTNVDLLLYEYNNLKHDMSVLRDENSIDLGLWLSCKNKLIYYQLFDSKYCYVMLRRYDADDDIDILAKENKSNFIEFKNIENSKYSYRLYKNGTFICFREKTEIEKFPGNVNTVNLFKKIWNSKLKQSTAQKTVKKELISGEQTVSNNMVLVKGGTFKMGDTFQMRSRPRWWANLEPVNKVTISSFCIGKYEVTQKEWKEVMGNYQNFLGDDFPVVGVNWYEAVEFCNKLSIKEGREPCYTIDKKQIDPDNGNNLDIIKWTVACNWSANGYRLPTEAEWEFAAKGGNKSMGHIYSDSKSFDDVAWHRNNSGYKIHPVGQKNANELDIYDMNGNACEWCWDWYDSKYYRKKIDKNPRGPVKGSSRVMRGGSSAVNPSYCVNAVRFSFQPYTSESIFGFRIVTSTGQ